MMMKICLGLPVWLQFAAPYESIKKEMHEQAVVAQAVRSIHPCTRGHAFEFPFPQYHLYLKKERKKKGKEMHENQSKSSYTRKDKYFKPKYESYGTSMSWLHTILLIFLT